MLQHMETSVDDPIITDNTVMTSGAAILGTGVLCACSDLQEQSAAGGPTSSQRFRVRGMETAVQGVRATSSGKLSPAKSDESLQLVCQQESGLKICEEQPHSQEDQLLGIFPTRK